MNQRKKQIRLANRIRTLREEKGWTPSEFARRLDKNRQHIKKLETPNNFKLETLIKIADVFEMTLSELLEGV